MKPAAAFTRRLHIRYPFIQAPMLGVSTPEMAAAVSNAGGLGSLALGGLSPEQVRELLRRTKQLTDKPVALNLFVHEVPAYPEEKLDPMREVLLRLAAEQGYALREKDLADFRFFTYRDQLDVLLEEDARIISFTFGCPDAATMRLLKQQDILLMGTATSPEEARILEDAGTDMIVLQGIEAGGHRGSFAGEGLPHFSLDTLLQDVYTKTNLPLIAAGGIRTQADMQRWLEAGVSAVQVGTPFIPTAESAAITAYKQQVTDGSGRQTALTRAFSGRWARGIPNRMMQALEQAETDIPPYPYQNSLTGLLRKMAQQQNDAGFTNLWAGEPLPVDMLMSSAEVVRRMVGDTF